jgi:hypothetical protein
MPAMLYMLIQDTSFSMLLFDGQLVPLWELHQGRELQMIDPARCGTMFLFCFETGLGRPDESVLYIGGEVQ